MDEKGHIVNPIQFSSNFANYHPGNECDVDEKGIYWFIVNPAQRIDILGHIEKRGSKITILVSLLLCL